MSDENSQYEIYKVIFPIIGALLSIMGGFGAVIIRSRVEKRDEIEYIKIGLTDELKEICSIMQKLQETYKTTKIVSNSYLNELNDNTESYLHHKQRIFLIKDSDLRRKIAVFYKDLHEQIKDSLNKVGKLGENPADGAHDPIVQKFNSIQSKGEEVYNELSKYRYKIFWII